MKTFIALLIIASLFSCKDDSTINIYYDTNSSIVSYGTSKLGETLRKAGYTTNLSQNTAALNGIFIITSGTSFIDEKVNAASTNISSIKNDGYQILKENGNIYIIGKTERGCLYGVMDITGGIL